MTPQQYERVADLFNAALEQSPDARPAFLSGACSGDNELRRAVADMLAADNREDHLLEETLADIAAEALLARTDESLIGRALGDYRITARLGAGGMGDVFLATDVRLRRKVALKFLPREFASDPARLKRFQQEACALSALNHPNIVTVYGLEEAEDLIFLATEFVEGQTLRQAMNQGLLPLDTAAEVGSQVAKALEAAHTLGIVHRDIKPENIMLRSDGLVKVLDFGLAKWMGTASGMDGLEALEIAQTTPGVIVGTPQYMSPEQVRGQLVDCRTDLFSLGAVLYEMVAGHAAMAGATPSDIIASILTRDPKPIAAMRQDCPRSLIRVIDRALEKDRNHRYPSAGEFLADLDACVGTAGKLKIAFPRRSVRYALAAAAACAMLLLSMPLVRSRSRDAVSDSIAVLPLRNDGGANLQFVADGLTDSLIGDLSEVPNLKVSPRSSVLRFRDQRVDPGRVGRMLKARTILLGGVSQSADRMHVELQLLDSSNNRRIWGETYNPVWNDLLTVQAAVSREVADKLRVTLNESTQRELEKRHDVRPEAYRLYLRGHSALHGSTRSDLETAVLYLHRALETDSSYGPAAVELANAYVTLADYISPREAMPKAREYALRGIELGGAPSEAHAALGLVKLLYDWDWKAAEKELQWDSPINPREVEAFSCYLHYKGAFGRSNESIAMISKLLRQDPLSAWMNHEMGCVSYYARRYDKAIEQFSKTVKIDPDFQIAYVNAGRAFVQQRRYDDAIKVLDAGRKIDPKWPLTLTELAYAHAAAGNRQLAIQILNELERIRQSRYVDAVNIALVYLRLGDRDRALSFLEKAYAERSSSMPWLNAEPRFDPLRSDARFQDLLRRVGLVG